MLRLFKRPPRINPKELEATRRFYPDLYRTGSLKAAVRGAFKQLGFDIKAEPYRSLLQRENGWPAYELADRAVSFSYRLDSRGFHMAFYECDEKHLVWETEFFEAVVWALEAWLVARSNSEQMRSRFAGAREISPSSNTVQ
jgi:hypothetical protein